jgi:hypothetical protein
MLRTNVTFSLEELALFSRMAGDLNSSSRCDRLWESIARFDASNAARESFRKLAPIERAVRGRRQHWTVKRLRTRLMNHEKPPLFSLALSLLCQSCGHQLGHPAPTSGECGLNRNARTDKPRPALPDLRCPPSPPTPMLVAWTKDRCKLSDEESERLKGHYSAVQWTRLERELQHLALLG